MSRGAWLVFPLALVALVVLERPGSRLPSLVEAALFGVTAVGVAPFVGNSFGHPAVGRPCSRWGWPWPWGPAGWPGG